MKEQLASLRAEALAELENMNDPKQLEDFRVRYMGKKGSVTALLRGMGALFAVERPRTIYKALPRFPAVERDLALLCDASKPVANIEKIIRTAGGKMLEIVELFDVYQGAQIEAGKKSVAYSLKFRVADRTLSDEDIDPILNKIFVKLKENDCILRT